MFVLENENIKILGSVVISNYNIERRRNDDTKCQVSGTINVSNTRLIYCPETNSAIESTEVTPFKPI